MATQINISWVARPRGGKWVDLGRIGWECDPDTHQSILKYLLNVKGVSKN